jgi:hypothetical protein
MADDRSEPRPGDVVYEVRDHPTKSGVKQVVKPVK